MKNEISDVYTSKKKLIGYQNFLTNRKIFFEASVKVSTLKYENFFIYQNLQNYENFKILF